MTTCSAASEKKKDENGISISVSVLRYMAYQWLHAGRLSCDNNNNSQQEFQNTDIKKRQGVRISQYCFTLSLITY